MQHTHRQPARCAGTRPPRGEEVTGEKRVTSEGSPEPGARRARCPHPAAQTAPGTGVSEPGPRHGGPLGSASRSGAEGSAPTRYPAAPCLIAHRFLLKRKPYRFNRPFIWKYLTFLFFFFFLSPGVVCLFVLNPYLIKNGLVLWELLRMGPRKAKGLRSPRLDKPRHCLEQLVLQVLTQIGRCWWMTLCCF